MLQQWNMSLQYELLPDLLVEGSYAGARGVHWVQRIDLNQVTFANALLGKNTQADRPFNFLAQRGGPGHRRCEQLVQLRQPED